ncbi:uncharacterized protein C18H10.09-like [Actinia tenebrosa]|uniref:Uncharacterized protein C18H10.09-like n=1 Tax=Actinia tenebrosa TaxID=6105 RepID=A0A6P8HLE1_ACTTE|nr:uncharacterized protein C18H10.09-like [Actinia tenebrosa]
MLVFAFYRSSAVRCDKCSNVLRITFRPAIIHQYSSTLGYLDLEGWHPFDLIMTEMQLTAGCLACSSETSIKGPHYGTNQVWCGKCHQKLAFKVESTRFFELTPTGVQGV